MAGCGTAHPIVYPDHDRNPPKNSIYKIQQTLVNNKLTLPYQDEEPYTPFAPADTENEEPEAEKVRECGNVFCMAEKKRAASPAADERKRRRKRPES